MRNLALAAILIPSFAGAAQTPLLEATLRRDRAAVFSLLARDIDVRSSDPQGRELILAILESRKAEALSLLKGGADANATIIRSEDGYYNGVSALMLASWSGDRDLVKALTARGAVMTAQVNGGGTALSYAADDGTAKLLLDLGYPADHETSLGATPLYFFAAQGRTEIVRLLIARGADVEKARGLIEADIHRLESSGVADQANKYRGAIQLLERLSRPPAAPQTATAGVTKAELAQMMKEAVAASARPAPASAAPAAPAPPAAPAAVVYRSDVDRPAYKISPNPDAYALVVGVERYNTLPDARFAERDAKAMNAHLLAMGYPQRNIVLLTGSQATRTGLSKNLEAWLPNNVSERSTVLFFFSGHGAPDAKTSQAYLVPMDGDPQYLEETAYPIKRLYAKLAALKAKRVIVALDSCFSGAGGRSVLAQGTRPLVAKLELRPVADKVVSLSASSSDEITGALEEQGHGLFTYNLLKALAETAGRGTVGEIYAALKPRVQDEARRQNRAQTPQIFGRSLDGGLR